MNQFNTVKDFEDYAAKTLPPAVYNYFVGGSGNEITLNENQAAFKRIHLLNRVLRNVASCSLETTVFGRKVANPFLIAPMAMQCLLHPEGEVAIAKAISELDSIMTLSTFSTRTMHDVAQASKNAPWFQLYIYRDRDIARRLVEIAESEGFSGLVLTVDTPIFAKRLREIQTPVPMPEGIDFVNLIKAGAPITNLTLEEKKLYAFSLLDPSVSWDSLDWLRSITKLPIYLKGITHPKDVDLALQHQIDGIIVSNHGGRQLDSALPTIEALPAIVEAAQGRIDIMIDSGIRNGLDIFKALALGAKAVMIGRPILWGLAAGGARGAAHVLQILQEELILSMILCGITSIEQLNREGHELIYRP